MSPMMVVALMNVAITAIFAIVAVKSGYWWIVLFSILATASYAPRRSGEEKKGGAKDENKAE